MLQACLSGSFQLVNMSKWLPQEEQQVYGTDERTRFISRCHQVLPKVIWEFSGIPGYYQFDFDMAQCSGSYVNWDITIMTMGATDFNLKEFSQWSCSQPNITNYPFWRLNSRLENYNPTRHWTVPEPRHRCSPPHRTCSTSRNAARQTLCRSRSVSFC